MIGFQHFAEPGSIPACAGEPLRGHRDCPGQRVYPRVCGGTSEFRLRSGYRRGLSPRVRGNREVCQTGCLLVGSIPACAGEPAVGLWAVYPRVCGGTIGLTPVQTSPSGLSPRVRGNLLVVCYRQDLRRSIPACAGEPRWEDGSVESR